MSLFVERKVPTELGEIEIAITRAEHISVQGHPEVRGTKFNCHIHFWRQADGTYAVRNEDRPNMTRAFVEGMSSADFNKSAPPTYFSKVLAAYTEAVNDFMASNPALAVEAENADIEREIGNAESKVSKAQEELSTAKAALDALYAKRQHLNSARPTNPA